MQSHTMRQGGIYIECFTRYLHLFMFRHGIKRSHIMQTVSNLDQNYPHIICQRQNHLTKTLGLLGRIRPHNLANFRQPVNE